MKQPTATPPPPEEDEVELALTEILGMKELYIRLLQIGAELKRLNLQNDFSSERKVWKALEEKYATFVSGPMDISSASVSWYSSWGVILLPFKNVPLLEPISMRLHLLSLWFKSK